MKKYCKDCKHFSIDMLQHPSGNYVKMLMCKHVECSDPVDASPIPCGTCRKEPMLCGLQGKYWQKDEKEVGAKDNVIQLAKD